MLSLSPVRANCLQRAHAPGLHHRRRTLEHSEREAETEKKKAISRAASVSLADEEKARRRNESSAKEGRETLAREKRREQIEMFALSPPPKHAPPTSLLSSAALYITRLPTLALARATEFPTALSAPQLKDESTSSSSSSTTTSTPSSSSLSQLTSGSRGELVVRCTRKCMPACIRGGAGAPGLGPLTLRKELVVFKEGFRDRSYCLETCTTACSALVEAAAERK